MFLHLRHVFLEKLQMVVAFLAPMSDCHVEHVFTRFRTSENSPRKNFLKTLKHLRADCFTICCLSLVTLPPYMLLQNLDERLYCKR